MADEIVVSCRAAIELRAEGSLHRLAFQAKQDALKCKKPRSRWAGFLLRQGNVV